MATAAVTYTFVPNTLVKSSEANTNFQDIVDFLNGSVIHKDASIAFTAIPSGPSSDPTDDNQFARKAYVDMACGVISKSTTWGSSTGGTELSGASTIVDRGVAIADSNITIETAGVYAVFGSWGVGTNTSGNRGLMIRKNGTNWFGDADAASNSTGFGKRITLFTVAPLLVGDAIDCLWMQSSGSNLSGDLTLGVFKIVGTD